MSDSTTQDDSYERFVESCAKECRCCPGCGCDIPCAGTMAGGICDGMCFCLLSLDEDRDEDGDSDE